MKKKDRLSKYNISSFDSEKITDFESLYYNAPFAYQVLDKNACFIDVNLRWCEETGYTKKDVIGKPFENIIIDDHKELFRKSFSTLLVNGSSKLLHLKLIKKNGKLITVSYDGCVSKNNKGILIHTNCILQNLSEQAKFEENYRRNLELENLRIEIWKSASLTNKETDLIQELLDKAGPVLGSENISFMPYSETIDNIVVKQVWRLDGTKKGKGEVVPKWVFNQFKKKAFVYLSFDDTPPILKPVLNPFQKKYGTKSTLVIPYGDSGNPRGYLSSQTYNYTKKYTDAEINVFIEISRIIYLKSKQLQSKKDLEDSQERFKNLTEQTNEGLVIHKNGIILEINHSIENMLGLPREKILNRNILEFVNPKYLHIAKKRIQELRTDHYELELIHSDGSFFYADTVGKSGVFQDQDVRVISINNITQRKLAEKELLKLSAIVEQSPISIVITDLNGNLEYVNPVFLETTGYTKEEVIGKNPKFLSTGNTSKEEYKEMWDQVLSGEVWRGKFFNKRKDGSTYWENATIAPVKNNKGKIIHIVGLKANISARIIAEQNLLKSQEELEETIKTRDKLFSIIAHDLRSPFNAILGFSEIMVNKSKENDFEGFNELSSYVYKSAKNSFNLLENLLHWSRIQTGKLQFNPEHFSLKEATEYAIELMKISAEEKRIDFILNFKKDISIYADRFMIDTVIRNLISNAVKFNPVGGSISIDCKKTKTEVIYSVTDNGVGIKKEDLNKLFKIDASYTTEGTGKEKGTGLGLILCKEFIEQHKGSIAVESEVNKETTFKFNIPLQ